MKHTKQIEENIAKINALTISVYQKEVIRSAYYNHLNNIPLPNHALPLLKQHGITFYNGNMRISNMNREERKKLYKRRESTTININTSSAYQKSFLQTNRAHPNALEKMLIDVEAICVEIKKLIDDCTRLTHECFTRGERSYSMMINIIETLNTHVQTSMQALNNFVQPFLELFVGLQPQAQKEILEKSNGFMTKIRQAKDTSASLCIKLSTIKAHNDMPKEQDFIQYLENTINKFDSYVK
ncbi:hypothetical protein [Helicobacter trogontum]|uniref:hypothetical protein n=1 Tax=Helicobacter trogontum TaxID=50960 RepID=UPI000CF19C62|nr:hypothetical protein [Helicobacter trogontum]MCI5787194.1 hypothetical protein [Helicobacter trogontum]MDY5186320.1 hypothetical protein [Helicobacter trogontum]